jgi:MFS family permease
VRVKWAGSFAPLRERNFAWYFAARFVNTAGSAMAGVAIAFAILDINDSASALGQVLAARTIPMVVFLLWGGVIADRVSRALIMQVSNHLSALTQGAVAFLVLTGHAELWMIIILEAVNGTMSAVSFPAMASVVPQLVPREDLQPANVLLSMSRGALAIIGPSVAAVLVVTVGPGWALAIDAFSWFAAAILISQVRLPPRVRDDGAAAPSMLKELREGWNVFTGIRWLWIVVTAFGLLNAIQIGALFTLGPALAKHTIGADGWGYSLSAESLGLLVMTAILLKVRVRYPLRAGMLGMSLLSAPILILGVNPSVLPLVVAMFIAGAGSETFNIGWNLAMQENIDDSVLSRAYSYDALGSFVAIPVGQLIYGPLGDAFGYRNVLVVSGIVYAATCAVTLASRSVRDLVRAQTPQQVVADDG